jgi:hypothetical protein
MLDEQTYMIAIYLYAGAACLVALCLAWWVGRGWGPGWGTLFSLLAAAVLLTPAYPAEGVDTMAPALVVAGFLVFTDGPEAAQHAIRPLAYFSGAAVVLAVLLKLVFFRRRKPRAADKSGAS